MGDLVDVDAAVVGLLLVVTVTALGERAGLTHWSQFQTGRGAARPHELLGLVLVPPPPWGAAGVAPARCHGKTGASATRGLGGGGGHTAQYPGTGPSGGEGGALTA